jgi:hypothetical protein
MKNYIYPLILIALCHTYNAYAQRFPGEEQNIEFLVNFGKYGQPSWGDDDFTQTIFVSVPVTRTAPFYVRVFDPGVGGLYDEIQGAFNTTTRFSFYGGKTAYTAADARAMNPVGNYKSGTIIDSKDFGDDPSTDGRWHTFGPFNPREGEKSDEFKAYIFKIIVQGVQGDDGNLYHLFASTDPDTNKPIDGAYSFAYEMTMRMHTNPNNISHFYPYINNPRTTGFSIYNFDFDSGGNILVFSVSKNGQTSAAGKDNEWVNTRFAITDKERLSAIDVQIYNNAKKNNNITLYCIGEDNIALPMYSVPIGGVPVYVYTPSVRYKKD